MIKCKGRTIFSRLLSNLILAADFAIFVLVTKIATDKFYIYEIDIFFDKFRRQFYPYQSHLKAFSVVYRKVSLNLIIKSSTGYKKSTKQDQVRFGSLNS